MFFAFCAGCRRMENFFGRKSREITLRQKGRVCHHRSKGSTAHGLDVGLNGKDLYLSKRLPATEQELMDQIKKAQRVFSKKDCDSIAIAVVTIEGAEQENTNGTYWMCILYQSVR